jgi:hypothetical protein
MRLELASKQPRNLPRNLDRVAQTGANLVADLTWTETPLLSQGQRTLEGGPERLLL